MRAIELLRQNIAALMKARGWTSNKPLISASGGRLTNGTLGRLRGDADDCKLSHIEDLAEVFEVPVARLVSKEQAEEPGAGPAAAPAAGAFDVELLAKVLTTLDPDLREEVSSALSDLARYPDSRLAIQRARNALMHGGIKGIPSWRETAIELVAEARHHRRDLNRDTLIDDIDTAHSEWLTRVSAKSARKTLTES